MKTSRYSPEQIIFALRQAENGVPTNKLTSFGLRPRLSKYGFPVRKQLVLLRSIEILEPTDWPKREERRY